jgi:hypothetical protein
MTKFPYTTKPEDIPALFKKLPEVETPVGKVDAAYIKSLGFSTSSAKYLVNILKNLGYLNEENEVSSVWLSYATDVQRGLVLASALKGAYEPLFDMVRCAYLRVMRI